MIIGFLIVVLAVIVCNYYLDTRVSMLVHALVHRNSKWSGYISDIPDILLIIVVIITAYAFLRYVIRARKNLIDTDTIYYELVAYTVPSVYFLKSVFKFIFGRINTREWLLRPDLYGFHWFNGGGHFEGFPSGHMAVFTALAAASWRCYPGYRIAHLTFIVMLALALIITNYHFLGDVIAGAYLGLLVELIIYKVISRYTETFTTKRGKPQ
jgi:membrane-associated phospholipid phosphatase